MNAGAVLELVVKWTVWGSQGAAEVFASVGSSV